MKRLVVLTLILTFLFAASSAAQESEVGIQTLLREGRFAELEERLEKLHIEKRENMKGWRKLTEVFDTLANLSVKDSNLQDQLNAWCEQSPSSYLAFTADIFIVNMRIIYLESCGRKGRSPKKAKISFMNVCVLAKPI